MTSAALALPEFLSREGVAMRETSPGSGVARERVSCGRCGGAGRSSKWAHTGYTCFECQGAGSTRTRLARLYSADQLATLNARRDATRAKAAAKRAAADAIKAAADDAAKAARAEVLAADPVFVFLSASAGRHEFLASMLETISKRDLTDKQRAAVEKWIAADVAKAATAARAKVAGHVGTVGQRCAIDATVVACRVIAAGFAYGAPERCLIKAETAEGATLVWFSAGREVGSKLIGTAMIFKQDDYQGLPQTTVKNFRAKKV